MSDCGTPALHAAAKCSCAGIYWTDTVAAEQAEYDRQSVHGGAFHQCDCPPNCYHPHLAHATCPAGHPIHLDVDHYDTPRWVHCTIADLAMCPAEMSDLDGDYVGKHRVTS